MFTCLLAEESTHPDLTKKTAGQFTVGCAMYGQYDSGHSYMSVTAGHAYSIVLVYWAPVCRHIWHRLHIHMYRLMHSSTLHYILHYILTVG